MAGVCEAGFALGPVDFTVSTMENFLNFYHHGHYGFCLDTSLHAEVGASEFPLSSNITFLFIIIIFIILLAHFVSPS